MKRTFEEFEKDYSENNIKIKINEDRIDDYIQKTTDKDSLEILCDIFVMRWNECVESFPIDGHLRTLMKMEGSLIHESVISDNYVLTMGGKPIVFFVPMDNVRKFNVIKIPWNNAMETGAYCKAFAMWCIPSSELFIETLILQFKNPVYLLPVVNNYHELDWKYSDEIKSYCRVYYNRNNKQYAKRVFFDILHSEIIFIAVDFLDKSQNYAIVYRNKTWVRCGLELTNSFIDQVEFTSKFLPNPRKNRSAIIEGVEKVFAQVCNQFRILSCFDEQI